MALYRQRGFAGCRSLDGSDAILKRFEVSASTNQAFFIGDAVTLKATGKLVPLVNAAAALAPVGIITMLEGKTSDNKPRPLTFSQPTNGPFLTSGQAGYATINVNPMATYTVQIDAAITDADYGVGAKVSAGAPDTRSGQSGQTLSATTTTSADAQFQIIGLAPIEQINGQPASVASPVLVEVKPFRAIFSGILV